MKRIIVAFILILMLIPGCIAESGTDVRYNIRGYQDGYFIVEVIALNEMGLYDVNQGMIDMYGNVVIAPEWEKVSHFHDGLALVWTEDNEKYGYVNTDGEMVIELDSTHVSEAADFSEGMALVRYDGKWGYIDTTGSFAIEPCIDEAEIEKYMDNEFWLFISEAFVANCSFNEGLAVFAENNSYGFIDKAGNIVIPCIYEDVRPLTGGAALVCTEAGEGLIDATGSWVCEPGEYVFGDIIDEFVTFHTDGLSGVMDTSGLIWIEPVWDFIYNMGAGIMYVEKDGMAGYLDVYSTEEIELTFPPVEFAFGESDLKYLGDGYGMSISDDKYGIVDVDGNVIAEPIYDYVGEYSDGLFAVCLDGKYGYIDADGNTVIDFVYDRAYPFGGGIAPVARCMSLGFIDTAGNEITGFNWNKGDEERNVYYEWNGRGVWKVTTNGVDQLVDTEGNIIEIGW